MANQLFFFLVDFVFFFVGFFFTLAGEELFFFVACFGEDLTLAFAVAFFGWAEVGGCVAAGIDNCNSI